MHKDNPSDQTVWPVELGENLWAAEPPLDFTVPFSEPLERGIDWDMLKRNELKLRCRGTADECLAAYGLIVDDDSRLKLAKAIAAAMQRASLDLSLVWGVASSSPKLPEPSACPHPPALAASAPVHGLRFVSRSWSMAGPPRRGRSTRQCTNGGAPSVSSRRSWATMTRRGCERRI